MKKQPDNSQELDRYEIKVEVIKNKKLIVRFTIDLECEKDLAKSDFADSIINKLADYGKQQQQQPDGYSEIFTSKEEAQKACDRLNETFPDTSPFTIIKIR